MKEYKRDTFSHMPLSKPLLRTPHALYIVQVAGIWF